MFHCLFINKPEGMNLAYSFRTHFVSFSLVQDRSVLCTNQGKQISAKTVQTNLPINHILSDWPTKLALTDSNTYQHVATKDAHDLWYSLLSVYWVQKIQWFWKIYSLPRWRTLLAHCLLFSLWSKAWPHVSHVNIDFLDVDERNPSKVYYWYGNKQD